MADEAVTGPTEAEAEVTTAETTEATTSPETQTDATAEAEGDKTADAEEGKAEGEEDAAEGAPEAYADFDIPEGVSLNEQMLEQFKEIAKGDNLSQDKAQKYVSLVLDTFKAADDAFAEQVVETRAGWVEAAKADKAIGGDKFEASLALNSRALKAYGTPELAELFDSTGIGSHPEIVRLLAKVGATVSEDKPVDGDTSGNPPKTAATVLYGGSK